MTIAQLTEKRAKAVAEARKIVDGAQAANRELTADERSAFDGMTAEADSLRADIERFQKLEAEERSLSESRGRMTETATEAKPDALRSWLLNPEGGKFFHTQLEQRAQSLTDAAGGYTVADGFVATLELDFPRFNGHGV